MKKILILPIISFFVFILRTNYVSAQTTSETTFLYNASGQRIARMEKVGNEFERVYYISPNLEITVRSDRNEWRKNYNFSGKTVAVREKIGTGTESVYYIHQDHLGSTSLVTNSSGNAVAKQRYYPYGQTRATDGTLPTDKEYTGQVSDMDQTGLYYYNARYYDPLLAKFTQADTANDQLNRYAYVGNNPINRIDPSGNSEVPSYIKYLDFEYPFMNNVTENINSPLKPSLPKPRMSDPFNISGRDFDNKYLLTRYSHQDIKINFENIAPRWFKGLGKPRTELFDYVVKQSRNYGVDPIFVLSVWLHESGASNYQGICQKYGSGDPSTGYCTSIQDIGYRYFQTKINSSGEILDDRFDDQLKHFLGLFRVYAERLESKGEQYNSLNFFACYLKYDCEVNDSAIKYSQKIEEIYGWLAKDLSFPYNPSTIY